MPEEEQLFDNKKRGRKMRKKTGNRLWIGLAVLTMTLACLKPPEIKAWPDNDPDTFETEAIEAFDNGNSDTAEASFEAAVVEEAITETAEGESTTETNLPELPDTADVSDASSNEEAPDEETISEDLAIVESAEVIETSQHDPSAEDETSSAEDSPDTTTSEEITPAQPCLTNLALCNDGNPCTDDACDEITGCQNTYNTAPCDDGLLCTEKDHCSENACVGDPVNCDDGSNCTVDLCQPGVGCTYTWICECKNASECDDGNPCTYDYCQDGFCLYTHNLSACNDNNACTSNDLCSNGKCVGADFDYNDGNLCTDDSCNPAVGVTYIPNNAPCDDGNACTINDACQNSQCAAGPALNCNDDNACTSDFCNPTTGCAHEAIVCDDNSVCTDDSCEPVMGCEHLFINCDDGNKCTVDSCDPKTSCNHKTLSCDDSDSCTKDSCDAGIGCIHAWICECKNASECNDGNPCTDDSCENGYCLYSYNLKTCDDGNFCTTNDTCVNGKCQGGLPPNCGDNNVCTDDSCEPTNGCKYTNNASDCDDNSVCTLIDKCESGVCVGSAPLDCDDGNECTLDICNKTLGCQHSKLSSTPCNDGDACTVSDTCQNGTCQAGTQTCECYTTKDCAKFEDGDFCNGTLVCDALVMPHKCVLDPTTITICNASQDTACQKNTCQPASGKCEMMAVNEGGDCDDGNPCTATDACQSGTCKGSPKPTGTVIFSDDFNDGDLNGWGIKVWKCLQCSEVCEVKVTNVYSFWIQIFPLGPWTGAELTSPSINFPQSSHINFKFSNPLIIMAYDPYGKPIYCGGGACNISTVINGVETLLGSPQADNSTPPTQESSFLITNGGVGFFKVKCSGSSYGSNDACSQAEIDDVSVTCP